MWIKRKKSRINKIIKSYIIIRKRKRIIIKYESRK